MWCFDWAGTPKMWILRLQALKKHVYKTQHVLRAMIHANGSKIATDVRDEELEKSLKWVTVNKQSHFTTVLWRHRWTGLKQKLVCL